MVINNFLWTKYCAKYNGKQEKSLSYFHRHQSLECCYCSVMSNSVTPMECSIPGFLYFITSWSLLKLRPIELMTPSNHLILCHPLQLLPSIFPNIWDFSNKLALYIWWSKYWSFSFSISPSNEYSGLISFRMDWLDLLVVQGLSRVFSNTTVQKHQFFSTQLSLESNSHIHT